MRNVRNWNVFYFAFYFACLAIAGCLTFSTIECTRVRAQPAKASAFSENVHVTARLIADTTAIQPGKPFKLGVELTMEPTWHTYYKISGDAGLPTKIEWKLPAGFTAGDLLWVKPEKFNDGGIVTYGYKDSTLIATQVTPAADLQGTDLKFSAQVKWLSCAEICTPGGTTVALSLPVDKPGGKAKPDNSEAFSKVGFSGSVDDLSTSAGSNHIPAAGGTDTGPGTGPGKGTDKGPSKGPDKGASTGESVLDGKFKVEGGGESQSLLGCIGLALVGGLILNAMPCVLPVIAIKVLSFFEQAGDEPARVRLLGLTFSAGIICSFLVLAAIVITLEQTGKSVGWGFLFQSPPFLIFMSSIVLLFSLSLFGMFYISAPGADKVDALANKEGYVGTFFKGVLATILSTPCTAPFLGTALGFAFAQPWYTVLLIFFTIGVGMSLPYLLLCVNPKWMKFMPKPGVWMEKFKESLGFALLATVAWLVSILGSELGLEGIVNTTYFLIAIAFATWTVSRFTNLSSTSERKMAFYAVAVVIVGIAFFSFVWTLPGIGSAPRQVKSHSSDSLIKWQRFTVQDLDKVISEHKTVLLDFTADWCLTCKYNEQTVLESAPVVEKIRALNVVPMQADFTNGDAQVTKLLNKFHRSGVPLYVIFPADKPTEPIVLPEVINQGMMLEKLDQAGPSK